MKYILPFTTLLFPCLASAQHPAAGVPERADPPTPRVTAPDETEWWGNWRGPLGTGVAPAGNPPTEWSEDKNIKWKVDVPGLGSSSPIVWEDRVYISTAIPTDRQSEAEQPRRQRGGRRRGGGMNGPAPTTVHEFAIMAFDRRDGSLEWSTTVAEAVPHEAGHPTNSQASHSPITDGEHIYGYFGSRGLHCLDMDGKVLWSKELGRMRTKLSFGEGSSPTLYGDAIVVNWDHDGDSWIAAFDKRTGDELWNTSRDETTSWSTPLVVEVDGRVQVIVTATSLTRSYDFETGELLWTLPGMTANAIPSPMYDDGIAYLMSGFRGYSVQAVRLQGARGDLSGSDQILWNHRRSTSYVPSALLYDGYYYFLKDNATNLSCLDARNGDIHYEGQRFAGGRSTVYSSPVGAAGRVYVTTREGLTVVIKLGPTFEEIASNQLDDGFDGTAAIVGDELYLRGRESLYCIAER